MFFFGQRSYAGFFSYLYALPGYTVYMSVFFSKNQPAPQPTPTAPDPTRPPRWSARQTVEFPTSHISFVTQHVLHVPVTGNISGQMHVLCHLCRIIKCKQVSGLYWKFEDSEQWDSRISQVTAEFGSVSYCQSLFTEITSKLTFQCLYSNLRSCRGLLQSKFEWNVAMETKH